MISRISVTVNYKNSYGQEKRLAGFDMSPWSPIPSVGDTVIVLGENLGKITERKFSYSPTNVSITLLVK